MITFTFKGIEGTARKINVGTAYEDYEFTWGCIRSTASRCNPEILKAIKLAEG